MTLRSFNSIEIVEWIRWLYLMLVAAAAGSVPDYVRLIIIVTDTTGDKQLD